MPVSRLSSESSDSTSRAVVGVEIAGGFVGDQQPGAVRQRAGDSGALHLAARHLLRVVTQPVLDADTRGEIGGAAIGIRSRYTGEQAGEGDVVADRERWQQIEELENEADPVAPDARQLVVGQRRQVAAFEGDRAARRTIHRAAEMEQRRLAATRRPMSATKSPASMVSDTPASALTVASPVV